MASFNRFAFNDDEDDDNIKIQPKKRKIIIFDDEEDDNFVSNTESNQANDSWIEARNSSEIQSFERNMNIKKAKEQRSTLSDKKIPKRETDQFGNKLDKSEIIDLQDSPMVDVDLQKILNKSNLIRNSLVERILDDFDPIEDLKLKKKDIRNKERSERTNKREEIIQQLPQVLHKRNLALTDEIEIDDDSPIKVKRGKAKTKKSRRILDSDEEENDNNYSEKDDDSDEEAGGQWGEEQTKEQIKFRAREIVKSCNVVSINLRNSILRWDGKSSEDPENNDCVNLTSLTGTRDATSKGNLLNDRDFEVLCPGLKLNSYQLVGVNWLKLLYENDVNGVLADDMGLGKTVQTISFLAWITNHLKVLQKSKYPHFIIVPASTLANWQNELNRFCPDLSVITYHGSQAERAELREKIRSGVTHKSLDVLLGTYTIFEREACKIDRSFLYSLKFEYLVLDEAHCIKNAESSRYSHLNSLKTKHRILLSGTPVQNNVSELLALLSFLMPSLFGRDNCEILLQALGLDKDNGKSITSSSSVSLNQLKSMLAPFVLRRLKRDVLTQLTDKTTRVEFLPMPDNQLQVYERVIAQYAEKKEKNLLKYFEEEDKWKTFEGRGRNSSNKTDESIPKKIESSLEVIDLIQDSEDIFESIPEKTMAKLPNSLLQGVEAKHLFTSLRKAANHPLLLRVHYTDPKIINKIAMVAHVAGHFGNQCDLDRVKSEFDNFCDLDIHQLCMTYPESLEQYGLQLDTLYDSPKLKYLKDLLPKLQEEGHRMLIFSQWTRLLDLLEIFLGHMDMKFLRLDGSTPIKERQELIDLYNSDYSIPVFLLSTKAGGLGINLTSADTVILHDLDFNPENDKQAEDRCHRIGQVKPVTVYKLIAKGTVDEDIYEMGERKRQLSSAVLSDHRSPSKGNSKEKDEDTNAIGQILSKALHSFSLRKQSKLNS